MPKYFLNRGLLVTALGDTDAQYSKTRLHKTFCELKNNQTSLVPSNFRRHERETSENLHSSEIVENHSPWSIFLGLYTG